MTQMIYSIKNKIHFQKDFVNHGSYEHSTQIKSINVSTNKKYVVSTDGTDIKIWKIKYNYLKSTISDAPSIIGDHIPITHAVINDYGTVIACYDGNMIGIFLYSNYHDKFYLKHKIATGPDVNEESLRIAGIEKYLFYSTNERIYKFNISNKKFITYDFQNCYDDIQNFDKHNILFISQYNIIKLNIDTDKVNQIFSYGKENDTVFFQYARNENGLCSTCKGTQTVCKCFVNPEFHTGTYSKCSDNCSTCKCSTISLNTIVLHPTIGSNEKNINTNSCFEKIFIDRDTKSIIVCDNYQNKINTYQMNNGKLITSNEYGVKDKYDSNYEHIEDHIYYSDEKIIYRESGEETLKLVKWSLRDSSGFDKQRLSNHRSLRDSSGFDKQGLSNHRFSCPNNPDELRTITDLAITDLGIIPKSASNLIIV